MATKRFTLTFGHEILVHIDKHSIVTLSEVKFSESYLLRLIAIPENTFKEIMQFVQENIDEN